MFTYLLTCLSLIVQELCESRGGRPGLYVPASLLVSVDVKQHFFPFRFSFALLPQKPYWLIWEWEAQDGYLDFHTALTL